MRTLKRKLISKKPKDLNETRTILLHLEEMKIGEMLHKSTVYS